MQSKNVSRVENKRCVACGACRKECPREAISIYKGCYALVDETLCVGCGKCEKICPVGCIDIQKRGELK